MPRTHTFYLTGLAGLVALFTFAYFDPASSVFPVHDFLDSILPTSHLRRGEPAFFDFSATLPLLGGVPLSALAVNDLSLDRILYVWLDPYLAAVVNDVVARVVAYSGMFLLTVRLLATWRGRDWAAVTAGAYLALLPYWPNASYTIAMQPLMVWAMLNLIQDKRSRVSWVVLLVSTQVVNFVLGGFAILGAFFLATGLALARRHNAAPVLTKASILLTVGFLVAIVRPLTLALSGFESHREDWPAPQRGWFSPQSWDAFRTTVSETVRQGQYHYAGGLSPVIVALLGLASVAGVLLLLRRRAWSSQISLDEQVAASASQGLIYTWLALLAVCAVHAAEVTSWTQFEWLLPLPFQVNRFVSLVPLLSALLLALGCATILQVLPSRLLLTMGGVSALLIVGFNGAAAHPGIDGRVARLTGGDRPPTLAEYYRTNAYEGLAQELGMEPHEIRVVSLGLDPMVAVFNGYRSFDGYVNNYPLEYKQRFRQVIRHELRRLPELREYFDGWGSRVYLFYDLQARTPLIDWCAAADLGARYVLTEEDLDHVDQLSLAATSGPLRAYAIDGCRAG